MVEFINPLDLRTIFVDVFSGGTTIFLFLSVLLISILAARFRMNGVVFLVMIVIFSLFIANSVNGLFVLVTIITGVVVFYILGRLFKL